MDGPELRRARLRAQGIDRTAAAAEVGTAVRAAGAVQAQDIAAARMSVRARTAGLTADDVVAAVRDDRTVVWTWAMRGTLHLVPAEDAGWMTALLGPVFAARDRRRRMELGLDDDLCRRGLAAISEVLSDGGVRDRADLVAAVRALGVAVDPVGQAPAHLVGYAAMNGRIHRIDNGAGPPAYRAAPVDSGADRDPDAALAELARRHAAAYGPVAPADFGYWSGLPAKAVRRAWELIEGELTPVDSPGGPMWRLRAHSGAGAVPGVRLAGAFDAVLLGYRDRRWVLPDAGKKIIQPGAGTIRPAVLTDAGVVGCWALRRERGGAVVVVRPFEEGWPAAGDAGLASDLAEEVADVGRFLGMSTRLQVD